MKTVTIVRRFLCSIIVTVTLVIFNLSTSAAAVGHISGNKCYSYFYHIYSVEGPWPGGRLYYKLGTKTLDGGTYYYLNSIGVKYEFQYAVELEVYEWVEGHWEYIDWWAGYIVEPEISEMRTILSNVGVTEGIYPTDSMPNGCLVDQCGNERDEIIMECGGEEKVDWSNWSDESCSGAVCNLPKEKNLGPPCEPTQCCQ